MMDDPTRRVFLTATATGLAALSCDLIQTEAVSAKLPESLPLPDWVTRVTRMTFATPGEVDKAAKAGAQVFHTNLVWPYFPLRRDGGGLSEPDAKQLRQLVAACHKHDMKVGLGLPPFPSVPLVKKHPDWRVHSDIIGSILKVEPKEDNLGTRVGCNLGPWGDYLIDVCAELVKDYQVDAFSFDGNYHPSLCYCPSCKQAYKTDRGRDLPSKVNLDDIAYREYLDWRGERLEDHYLRLQRKIKAENRDAVIMTWSVNAGRYGHFLYSPRAMPTRLNRLFDLAMQEWWLDETNLGGSVAPAFGAAYLRTVMSGRPCAAEPYMMSRGNPYSSDSFPAHELLTRTLLAVTNGNAAAVSLGWPGHLESAATAFHEVERRSRWMTDTTPVPWAALLVSEQTRQFYAYKDIAERFLPHVFGAFRTGMEEHLPVTLVNDWDINTETLSKFAVLILPNAAALSNAQVEAIRAYVKKGGGLVATGETSLCDELGRPRGDFALSDVFGVHYEGRPNQPLKRPELDENFRIALDETYWKQRIGVATLNWENHELFRDEKLQKLTPNRRATFRGPLVKVSDPGKTGDVIARMKPEGTDQVLPAIVVRSYGAGRVVYFAACADAAMYSYAYPYQRRMLARSLAWSANAQPQVNVVAPMCVQATMFHQQDKDGRRLLIHLFNGVNTAGNHGLPAMDVPLREETIPIHGIKVQLAGKPPKTIHLEPGNKMVKMIRNDTATEVELPPLELQMILVVEE